MTRPDIIDPSLGRLHYDENLDWYEGEFIVGDSPIAFHLRIDEQGEIAPTLDRARQVFGEFERYARGARDFAVQELPDLKNESWLDGDEDPVTPEQFQARIELEGLVFSPDGEVAFYHRDGDLFCGHCIQISMDGADCFVDADIPG